MAATSKRDLKRFAKAGSRTTSGLMLGLVANLLFAAIAVVAAVVLLVSVGLVDGASIPGLGPQVDQLLSADTANALSRRALAFGTSALVGLFSVSVLLRGIGKATVAPPKMVLSADENGMVLVDAKGISVVASEPLMNIPGVLDVHVEAVGNGEPPIRLRVNIVVSGAAELKKVGDEARQRAADAVQNLVGIEVQAVVVNFDVVPLRDLSRRMLK
jgi:hypothetical protein